MKFSEFYKLLEEHGWRKDGGSRHEHYVHRISLKLNSIHSNIHQQNWRYYEQKVSRCYRKGK